MLPRKYENVLEERVSPHGKRYFWIGGKVKELEQENDSDIIAIEEGYITITPVNIDMTNNKKIEINFFILLFYKKFSDSVWFYLSKACELSFRKKFTTLRLPIHSCFVS